MTGTVRDLFARIRRSVRQRRYKVIADISGIENIDVLILDLGGGVASFFAALYPDPARVVLIDIDPKKAALAHRQKPKIQVVVGDAECLPFAGNSLRFTVSNSIIEHVNAPDAMASEVHRVGQGYFLQTPNGAFPIETHSFIPIPFYNLVPARWIKKTLCALFRANFEYISTVRYLSEQRLKALFPEAKLMYEKAFGVKKSFYIYLANKN